MLRRHARTTVRVLEEVGGQHLEEMVGGRLPATCLLRLAVAPPVSDRASDVDTRLVEDAGEAVVRVGDTDGPATGPSNRFARSGEVWAVTFRGRTVHLTHEVGLLRLAGLLAEPSRAFTPFELVAATEPADPTGRVDAAEAAEAGLGEVRRGRLGTLIDDQAKAEYQSEVKRLLGEAEEARDAGDRARAADLDRQVKRIVQELDAATGLLGRLRLMEDDVSTLRATLNASLRRALSKIEREHPDLGRHLRQSLLRRTVFTYDPDPPITWDVSIL